MSTSPLNEDDTKIMAVLTTGNGGYEKLEYCAVPRPIPGPGEVLLRILAASVNNTEINTRLGWYSSGVTADTRATSQQQETDTEQKSDGGWNGATPFPLFKAPIAADRWCKQVMM